MKKAVFFDFYGVLCSEATPVWFARHFDKGEALVLKEKIFSKADMGEVTEKETFDAISAASGVPVEQIKAEYRELSHVNLELVRYICNLKKDYKVYLLSNANGEVLNRVLKELELYDIFDTRFISSEMKKVKPNAETYEYVLEKTGHKAEESVFIDDNMKNVKGANDVGITGILFKDNKSLFEQLENIL